MPDISDLSSTVVQKTDQLNAENLLAGPTTVRISKVTAGTTEEQPVFLHYEGGDGKPYKPCKTMRKMLVMAWGKDGRKWAGNSMTLYCDPAVKFGGVALGGIRISHVTGIDREMRAMLAVTKGKKAEFVLRPIAAQDAAVQSTSAIDHGKEITEAQSIDALRAAFAAAWGSTKDKTTRDQFKATYEAMTASLDANDEAF